MSEEKLTNLSSSLSSGIHRYAGNSDHLKLRLLFTDHALLATRPRFRSTRQAHQIGHKPPTTQNKTNKQTITTTATTTLTNNRTQNRPKSSRSDNFDELKSSQNVCESGFFSSYLIKKHKKSGRWSIRPEVESCLLRRSGLRLRVMSGCNCVGCVNMSSNHSSGASDEGKKKENNKDIVPKKHQQLISRSNGATKITCCQDDDNPNNEDDDYQHYHQHHDKLTKSERALNWKDTVTVNSDKSEWKHTVARKLPSSKNKNHMLPNLSSQSDATAATSIVGEGFDICTTCCKRSSSSSSSSLDQLKINPTDSDGCLTDWYRRQLLNKGRIFSADHTADNNDNNNKLADKQQTVKDSRAPVNNNQQKREDNFITVKSNNNVDNLQQDSSDILNIIPLNNVEQNNLGEHNSNVKYNEKSNSKMFFPSFGGAKFAGSKGEQLSDVVDLKLEDGSQHTTSKLSQQTATAFAAAADNTISKEINMHKLSAIDDRSQIIMINGAKQEENNTEKQWGNLDNFETVKSSQWSHKEVLFIKLERYEMNNIVDNETTSGVLNSESFSRRKVDEVKAVANSRNFIQNTTLSSVSAKAAATTAVAEVTREGLIQDENNNASGSRTLTSGIMVQEMLNDDEERRSSSNGVDTSSESVNFKQQQQQKNVSIQQLGDERNRYEQQRQQNYQDKEKEYNDSLTRQQSSVKQTGVGIVAVDKKKNDKTYCKFNYNKATSATMTVAAGAGKSHDEEVDWRSSSDGECGCGYDESSDNQDDSDNDNGNAGMEGKEEQDDENEINLTGDTAIALDLDQPQDRWMLNEQLRRHLSSDDSSSGCDNSGTRLKFCCVLVVIVIDKLNRIIQMKPDINKLISVDIGTELAFDGRFCGRNSTTSNIDNSAIDATTNTNQMPLGSTIEHSANTDSSKVSMTPAVQQIQQNLLYQLELADNDEVRGSLRCRRCRRHRRHKPLAHNLADSSDGKSEVKSEVEHQLDLLYEHLFWKPNEHFERQIKQLTADRCDNSSNQKLGCSVNDPIDDGGMLIKLQFDIHFASEFPSNCHNLYVKYKLLAKLRSSKWKLIRQVRKQEHFNRLEASYPPKQNSKNSSADLGMRMKEEIAAANSSFASSSSSNFLSHDGKRQKLAQMSHFITPNTNFKHQQQKQRLKSADITNNRVGGNSNSISISNSSSSSSVSDDESKKPSAKSILPTESLASAEELDLAAATSNFCNDGHQLESKQTETAAQLDGPDTCLLEGSTITSEPDSRGQFHFACVEELVLEFVTNNNNTATKSHPPLSSSMTPNTLTRSSKSDWQQQAARPRDLTQRRNFESTATTINGLPVDQVDTEVTAGGFGFGATNNQNFINKQQLATAASSNGQSNANKLPILDDDDDDDDELDKVKSGDKSLDLTRSDDKIDRHQGLISTNNNETGYENSTNGVGYESALQTPGNKSIMVQKSEVANDATCPRDLINHADNNNYCSNITTTTDNTRTLMTTTTTTTENTSKDEELEIVILLEFYSSDFYRDKLQGWSHLSVPVDLDTNISKTINHTTNNYHQHCSRDERPRQNLEKPYLTLPVIRPELCSLVDKLRYYLIGQLPASMPTLESFARSNQNRYMLLTKQSGKLVLNFEVVRQLSYPNFDTASRDLFHFGKGHGKEGKRNQYNGTDLDHQHHHSGNLMKPTATSISGATAAVTSNSVDSDCSYEERDGLDTQRVVEAYKRAKDRIDKLNLNPLLSTN